MYARIKTLVFHLAKLMGLFALARRITRRGLRILCYHSFSTDSDAAHEFRPGTFMRPQTFRRRMDLLAGMKLPVLPLHDAVNRLRDGALPPCAVVITFDDGAASTWLHGIPVLLERNLPGTIYVTTYYCVKQTPVFRMAVQYMLWKSQAAQVNLAGLGLPSGGVRALPDASVAWEIIDFCESSMHDAARNRLAAELGNRLGVPYGGIVAGRVFSIMTFDEIREAARAGVDIQLHAHRHRLPDDPEAARREIRENRAVLEPLVARPPSAGDVAALKHFCYPSGVWNAGHFATLRSEGILSATTCEAGLNYAGTPPLALRRFLDGEQVSDIEFEAELSGFSELLRRIFRRRAS